MNKEPRFILRKIVISNHKLGFLNGEWYLSDCLTKYGDSDTTLYYSRNRLDALQFGRLTPDDDFSLDTVSKKAYSNGFCQNLALLSSDFISFKVSDTNDFKLETIEFNEDKSFILHDYFILADREIIDHIENDIEILDNDDHFLSRGDDYNDCGL